MNIRSFFSNKNNRVIIIIVLIVVLALLIPKISEGIKEKRALKELYSLSNERLKPQENPKELTPEELYSLSNERLKPQESNN